MSKNNNNENNSWDMMAKYLADESSDDEKTILESRISESEEIRNDFNINKHLFEKVDLFYKTNRFDEEKALKAVLLKTKTHKIYSGKNTYLQILKYAAMIIMVAVLGTIGYYIGFKQQSPDLNNEIVSTEKQVLREITLPDGTVVALNSNSKIFFPDNFHGKTREVKIQGEAFFDVKPNPENPFVITAGNTQIRVLGTSFNISAYPGSETVEVIVETGSVQVINMESILDEEDKVLLNPGEKGTLFVREKTLQKTINNDPNFIAWNTHEFIFTGTTLAYVIQNLEKTYHVKIKTSSPELEKLILTAHFKDKPLDFILEVIQMTFNLELSTQNGGYLLTDSNS